MYTHRLHFFITFLLTVNASLSQQLKLPKMEPLVLQPRYTLDYWGKLEISGIVKSRFSNNVFWIHNDSGDNPRIFAIDSTGKFYQGNRYRNYEGISVAGSTNVDWEDITTDDKGNVVVSDFGNNGNDRKDLVLYVIPEPAPNASNTTYLKKIFFNYPDQKAFPDTKEFNFDAEAVFFADGKFHILSKNRSDTYTKLYRLDSEKSEMINPLTLVNKFDIGGKVTAADATPDGNRIAVLTYNSIWIFERTGKDADYFSGNIWWLPVKAPQVESLCFKDLNTLWLVDEQTAAIFEVPFKQLVKVK